MSVVAARRCRRWSAPASVAVAAAAMCCPQQFPQPWTTWCRSKRVAHSVGSRTEWCMPCMCARGSCLPATRTHTADIAHAVPIRQWEDQRPVLPQLAEGACTVIVSTRRRYCAVVGRNASTTFLPRRSSAHSIVEWRCKRMCVCICGCVCV